MMRAPSARSAMTIAERAGYDGQPAYVLHTYAFRETSLITEAYTRAFGRIALVARGARRPKSALRGVLQEFQPLTLSWFGKGELRTLAKAEWQGGQPLLAGTALLCGLYLNELLIKLLPRDDPHELLFDQYSETLRHMSASHDQAPLLRRFETSLLRELGYAMALESDAETGAPVQPERQYVYIIERGPVAKAAAGNEVQLSGKSLLDMARGDYSDPLTALHSKQLMRRLISHYLGDQPLHTRELFKGLQQL
jgi:DNA repair protein RecO (recombination protein O)